MMQDIKILILIISLFTFYGLEKPGHSEQQVIKIRQRLKNKNILQHAEYHSVHQCVHK